MQDEEGRALLDVSMSSPFSGQARRLIATDHACCSPKAFEVQVVQLDPGLWFNLTASVEPTDLPLNIGVRIVAPNGLQHRQVITSPTASVAFAVCPSTLTEYSHSVSTEYRLSAGATACGRNPSYQTPQPGVHHVLGDRSPVRRSGRCRKSYLGCAL
jgi:hypothetical protein